jgi:hypothetical protein
VAAVGISVWSLTRMRISSGSGVEQPTQTATPSALIAWQRGQVAIAPILCGGRRQTILAGRLKKELAALARLSRDRRPGAGARASRLLSRLARTETRDPEGALSLHEAAIFLAAYPHDPRVKSLAERILSRFDTRMRRLEEAGLDLSLFDTLETGGVAGTTVATEFTYDITRWLARHAAGSVAASWDVHESPDRLGATWPRWLPLLEEEALADAGVPYLEWLTAGRGRVRDLDWLLSRFEALPLSEREKAERFDATAVVTSWELGRSSFSRTLLRKPGPRLFFHPGPLLSRRDVDFAGILSGPPLPARHLSRAEGERMLDRARGTTAARYREFYGFTYGDAAQAVAARPGRGVEIFFFGVERPRRLPLRATYSAIVFKNGVAVSYFEGLALFERMEAGFNVYYSFREGESAWIYAQVLRLCRQVAGVTSFSVDPYQIGRKNEEAIASGAFWFYRKLGFRPTDTKISALVAREEDRLARRKGYRTSAATLRRIATCNLLYEIPGSRSGADGRASVWDRFHIRRVGLAVNRRMARAFAGDADRIRRDSERSVARKLRVNPRRWSDLERRAFSDWALVLDLIPGLSRWSAEDRRAVLSVIRAKATRSEAAYLRLSRRHELLRTALIRLGSRS